MGKTGRIIVKYRINRSRWSGEFSCQSWSVSYTHLVVETMAHYQAAKHFNPNVDFIIDIGGQDMKCFRIKALWA